MGTPDELGTVFGALIPALPENAARHVAIDIPTCPVCMSDTETTGMVCALCMQRGHVSPQCGAHKPPAGRYKMSGPGRARRTRAATPDWLRRDGRGSAKTHRPLLACMHGKTHTCKECTTAADPPKPVVHDASKCVHGKIYSCKACGRGYCEHGVTRYKCRACKKRALNSRIVGLSGTCEHGRKYMCKECKIGYCEHGFRKYECDTCRANKEATIRVKIDTQLGLTNNAAGPADGPVFVPVPIGVTVAIDAGMYY